MAFRDDKYAPWTIAVVRRLNRVTGTLVELGVEYLGHDPQACVLAAGSAPAEGTASEARSDRIAAIFLPPNAANARRPVASLLLPACEFAAGRTLTLVTAMDETVIRLKTPKAMLRIDDDKGEISLSDGNSNSILMSKDGIEIKSGKDFKLEAKGKVTLKGASIDAN